MAAAEGSSCNIRTRRPRFPGVLILAVLLALTWLIVPAQAQQSGAGHAAVELPQHLTETEARDLMSRLSDDQVRQLLLEHLDATASASDAAGQEWIRGAERARESVDRMLAVDGGLWTLPNLLWDHISDNGDMSLPGLLLRLLVAVGFGYFIERLFRRLLLPSRSLLLQPTDELVTSSKIRRLAAELAAEVALLAVFAMATFAASVLLLPSGSGSVILFSELVRTFVLARFWVLVSHAALAPRWSKLRVPDMGNEAARALHSRLVWLMVALLAYRMVANLMQRFGMAAPRIELWEMAGSLIWVMAVVLVVWMGREPIAAKLMERADRAGIPRHDGRILMASRWHLLASGYVIVVWALAALVSLSTGAETLAPALMSLIIGALMPLANRTIHRVAGMIVEQGRKSAKDTAESEPSESEKTRTEEYRELVIRNLRILLTIGIVALLARIWGVKLGGLMEALVGSRLADSLVDIALILVITYALWGTLKVAIGRHLGHEDEGEAVATVDEPGGTGLSRVETLLPLLRKTAKVVLFVAAALVCLSELGVDIGPLLAGAGVAGIAIGFGAQSLVRDVVSGFFFLLDDAFRMGEYVEIEQIRGTVQKISTRSLQLRHHNGPVHTVPFGEIRHLTNYSRDWAIMKFEIRLPFETDVDKVRRLIKRAGLEMMEDPDLAPLMLEPLKSQGVVRMDDSALIMRCKFTSRPGQQFYLRREAFVRIQRLFEQRGIHFAPRRVIVESAAGQPPPTPAAAAAAAAGSMDRQHVEEQPQQDEQGPG
jgi:small-conductance mechanosensitive channel